MILPGFEMRSLIEAAFLLTALAVALVRWPPGSARTLLCTFVLFELFLSMGGQILEAVGRNWPAEVRLQHAYFCRSIAASGAPILLVGLAYALRALRPGTRSQSSERGTAYKIKTDPPTAQGTADRAVAWLIDVAIYTAVGAAVAMTYQSYAPEYPPLAQWQSPPRGTDDPENERPWDLDSICLVLVCGGLFLLKDMFGGTSPGKAFFRLQVVECSTGLPIGPARSLARNVLYCIPFVPVLEALVAITKHDRRRLGDTIAGTMVVRAAPSLATLITNIAPDPRRSTLRRREWAYALDGAIFYVAVVLATFAALMGIVALATLYPPDAMHRDSFIFQLLHLTIFVAVLEITWLLLKDSFFSGRSPAKSVTGLRVVDATSGSPVSPLQSVARNLVFLLPFFPILELIIANVRQDRRRLGDLLANTLVVSIDFPLQRFVNQSPDRASDDGPMRIASDRAQARATESTADEARAARPENAVLFVCPSCARRFKVSPDRRGRRAKCRCGHVATIPL